MINALQVLSGSNRRERRRNRRRSFLGGVVGGALNKVTDRAQEVAGKIRNAFDGHETNKQTFGSVGIRVPGQSRPTPMMTRADGIKLSVQIKSLKEELAQLQADVAEAKEASTAAVTALASQLDEQDETSANSLAKINTLLQGVIKVINAGDVVHNPQALAIAEAIDTFAELESGSVTASQLEWMGVIETICVGLAYYDAAEGLKSLIETDGASTSATELVLAG